MKQLSRELFLPKPSIMIADEASDAVAYTYTDDVGRLGAAIFVGKRGRPASHYFYHDAAQREAAIGQAFRLRSATLAARGSSTRPATDRADDELSYH